MGGRRALLVGATDAGSTLDWQGQPSATASRITLLTQLVLVVLVGMSVRRFGALLLLQEIGVREGRKNGRLVYNGRVVDLFMHSDSVVDRGGLDSLTLYDRLDCGVSTVYQRRRDKRTSLVNVVVLVLIHMHTSVSCRSLNTPNLLSILVQRALLVQLLLVLGKHILLVLARDDGSDSVNMLGVERAMVLDGLDAVLVVMDMVFPVNSLDSLGVLLRTDVLLGDGGGDLAAHLGSVGLVGRLEKVFNALGDCGHCRWFVFKGLVKSGKVIVGLDGECESPREGACLYIVNVWLFSPVSTHRHTRHRSSLAIVIVIE